MIQHNYHKFLIAAANSGAGKTTMTLGLIRALRRKGNKVQPFKCGPDYIDTKLHELASAEKAVNLDLFLSSEKHVKSLFEDYSARADISIVEGVMGLFDGYDKMEGSAAQVAISVNCPIILVVNAKATAYSVAALLYGFKNFNKSVQVVGAIFNFVGSASHYQFLKQACEDVGVAPLGYLPKNEDLVIPSRHLGLMTDNMDALQLTIDHVADEISKTVDIDKLLEITKCSEVLEQREPLSSTGNLKIGVAKDEAFNFMYEANISALRKLGEVTFFSPIHDEALPLNCDLVYLPGGYPELYAKELSLNTSMKGSVEEYVEQGGKLFAECGGMMYMSSAIQISDYETYEMVGVFKQIASMVPMKLKLGYRYFNTKSGVKMKGHEFHYSHLESDLPSRVQQYGAKKQQVDTKLVRYKNAIAGYTHLYWAEENNLLNLFKDM